MSRISPVQPIAEPATGQATDLRDVDVSQFLDLLIAELQNQDPLDPVDNSEMAQQISQIREIAATDKLSDTLSSVLAGLSLTTASSLIGKRVEALSEEGETISGTVDRVSVQTDEDDSSVRTYRIPMGAAPLDPPPPREITAE